MQSHPCQNGPFRLLPPPPLPLLLLCLSPSLPSSASPLLCLSPVCLSLPLPLPPLLLPSSAQQGWRQMASRPSLGLGREIGTEANATSTSQAQRWPGTWLPPVSSPGVSPALGPKLGSTWDQDAVVSLTTLADSRFQWGLLLQVPGSRARLLLRC